MKIWLQIFVVAAAGFLPLAVADFLDNQMAIIITSLFAIAAGQLVVFTLARMALHVVCKCGLGKGPITLVYNLFRGHGK